MTFWVYPGGHDMRYRANLDSLGQLYISFTILWTLLIASGIAFLLTNRKVPTLRMRNLPLGIAAVCTLHVYWCLSMLAYVLNGLFPCGLEYWVMSTFLPFGIALYQANSTQLRHVAGLQKRFAGSGLTDTRARQSSAPRGVWRLKAKWNSSNVTKRATFCIAVGMVTQVVCTLLLFLISKRFHSSWGLVGHKVDVGTCRKGWEWLPSIAWQFIWSWLYAPYLLWKIKGIKDVHGWRVQTVLCSLAGLPGSPMWLIALYVPGFSGIDKYWAPPLWFFPGIIVMETTVILFPCWQVVKNRNLRKETLEILAEWEKKQKDDGSMGSNSSRTAVGSVSRKDTKSTTSAGSRKGEMYTMNALEKALHTNSTPLLLFAALKDFSGENISFLNHIRDWKASWSPPSNRHTLLRKPQAKRLEGEELRRYQFNAAVQVYVSLVGVRYSDFPINLSSSHRKELEVMFDGAAAMISTHIQDNSVTPFNDMWVPSRPCDLEGGIDSKDRISVAETALNNSTDEIVPPHLQNDRLSGMSSVALTELQTCLPADVPIPDLFGEKAFDNAEESIKYMVLTNTWPKFVTAGYANCHEEKTVLRKMKDGMPAWVDRCVSQWTERA